MNITRVGVDIAKSVFHVHAVDRHEATEWQAKLKRSQWVESLCERVDPGAKIGMIVKLRVPPRQSRGSPFVLVRNF